MRCAAIVLVVLVASAPARAGGTDDGVNDKSLAVGLGLSAGGTAVGLAMATAGLAFSASSGARATLFAFGGTAALIMPTSGHWYARGGIRGGTVGSSLRVAAGCVGAVALMLGIAGQPEPGERGYDVVVGTLYTGLALLGAGVIVDIATTPAAIRRANRRPNRAIDIGLAPVQGGVGVALGGRL